MALGVGYRAAFAVEATFGTPVVLGATHLLPFHAEGVEAQVERVAQREQRDSSRPFGAMVTDHALGTTLFRGPLVLPPTYGGLGGVLEAAFGTVAAAAVPPSLTRRTYTRSAGLPSATLAVDKRTSLWQYRGVTVAGWEIRGRAGAPLELTLDLLALDADEAGGAQDAGTWTAPAGTIGSPVLFLDGTFQVAPYSASVPLAVGDKQNVTEFALRADLALDPAPDAYQQTRMGRPFRTGGETVAGSIVLPRYESNALYQAAAANTALMGKFEFVGPDKAPGEPYRLTVWVPTMRIDHTPTVEAPALVRPRLAFRAELPAAAPAGFPAVAAHHDLVVETET